MNRSTKLWLVPSGLFLLNFLAGLLFLNEGLFHMDSVALAMAVEKTYQTGMLQPGVLGRYGAVLINSILYLPFYLLGQNADLMTRLSSVLFHSLSVVAFYHFIYNLFRNRIQAFFGALLLSFTPLYFIPNTYGKEHGMGIFFLLVSFIILHRGVKKGNSFTICLASLCYVFAIAVREAQLSTLPLFILLFFSPHISSGPFKISFPKKRLSLRFILSFFAPLVILLGIMSVWYLVQAAQGAELYRIFKLTTAGNVFADIGISMPLFIFVFLFLGIWRMVIRRRWFWTVFFVIWLLLLFVHGFSKWYTARFLDVALIPIYVFASYALFDLFSNSRPIAIAMVTYCVLSMFLFMYPLLSFRHHYNGEKRLAEYVKLHTEPNAIIVTEDQFPFIQYYGQRTTEWLPMSGDQVLLYNFIHRVEGYIRQGKPVYYTDSVYRKKYERWSLFLIQQGFQIEPLGGILMEDYHRPELRFRFAFQKLYRLRLPSNNEKQITKK